jgi:hypothetical protein
MKKALIDTSSAILLYKAALFSKLAVLYELIMTASVFAELTVTGYPGAKAFADAHQQGNFTVVSVPEGASHPGRDPGTEALVGGAGERDTIAQYFRGMGDFIVVDDKKAAEYCKNNKVPFINALLCARLLRLTSSITENEHEKAIQKLLSIGRYSDPIIHYALNCPIQKLSFFVPD